MTDTTGELEDTARSLGTRTLPDGTEADVLAITRTYPGDVEELWGAVTEPERIARWFLPVSGDLTVGGRYRIEGNAEGEVLTCRPPTSYSVTWEYGGDVSWVEVELTPVSGDRTRFELRHIARPSGHWKTYGPGAVGVGWDLGLRGLAEHLATGEAVDPAAAEAWSLSEDGRRFLAASADAWCAADVARGADPGTARAAADRTIAFYTGEEAPAS